MTTYTIALSENMILATVPDGSDIAAAVAAECETARIPMQEFTEIAGCTLTDEQPDDTDTIIWRSGNCGWVMDENGIVWRYAVKA